MAKNYTAPNEKSQITHMLSIKCTTVLDRIIYVYIYFPTNTSVVSYSLSLKSKTLDNIIWICYRLDRTDFQIMNQQYELYYKEPCYEFLQQYNFDEVSSISSRSMTTQLSDTHYNKLKEIIDNTKRMYSFNKYYI